MNFHFLKFENSTKSEQKWTSPNIKLANELNLYIADSFLIT